MSFLNSVTSFFEPKPNPIPREDCKPARPDDCGDGKESRWNDDHKGRDHWKNGDKDDYSKHGKDDSKHAKNDDDHKGRGDHWKNGDKDDHSKHDGKDDHSKHGKDDYGKHAKNDDCSDDGHKDGHSKHGGKDDYSKDGKGDHSKHDGGWKDAKNDDCQPKDYCQPPKDYCPPKDCQPQKDYCAPRPSDDCGNGGNGNGNGHGHGHGHGNGNGDTHQSTGEALANFDFSRGDFGSHGPDHSGDVQGALASMSSEHALDYAINQLGPADHFDIGHDDVTSHDTVHHA